MTTPHTIAPLWLDPDDPNMEFPDVELALQDPNGLLAIGGDLSLPRLLAAYRNGIFPWYSAGQPILWWSPDPRCILANRESRSGSGSDLAGRPRIPGVAL